MNNFCEFCGKKLKKGEACDCPDAQSAAPAMTPPPPPIPAPPAAPPVPPPPMAAPAPPVAPPPMAAPVAPPPAPAPVPVAPPVQTPIAPAPVAPQPAPAQMVFCQYCGSQVAAGGVCVCGQPAPPAAAPLPQTAAVVANVTSNPIVADLIATVKALFSPNAHKTVGEAGKRTDIMWAILAAIEAIICGVATVYGSIQALVYVYNERSSNSKETYKTVTESIIKSFKDYEDMEVSMFEIYFRFILTYAVGFAIFAGLLFAVMSVYKKKANFSNICNMLAVAFIPSTVFMVGLAVLCMMSPPVSLLALAGAVLSAAILIYQGMQGLDNFETPPYWLFMAFIALAFVVSFYYVGGKILEDYLDPIVTGYMGSVLLNW